MNTQTFLAALQSEQRQLKQTLAAEDGDWAVKGFIDVTRNIYTISLDTKVISKIIELLLFPDLLRFAEQHQLEMVLAEHQNFYPDISFVDAQGNRFALDLKSTYRTSASKVSGMALGAFTGYFRDRQSTKNITFPYGSYAGHIVLGIIYSRREGFDERQRYRLEELGSIRSVIGDFELFVQEKYRIASDRPGSGNTKNIGSIRSIENLLSGTGPFSELGVDVFDDYWMYYLTRDMARAAELHNPPYTNLETYRRYRGLDR